MAEFEKGVAYSFQVSLTDALNPTEFRSNPTIEAGDFLISKDAGALVNLTSLPIVSPAGSEIVNVSLSATETDADRVTVIWNDVTGDEWLEESVALESPTLTLDGIADAVWNHPKALTLKLWIALTKALVKGKDDK